ncbi:unnamed protein product [Trichogramma brassicae]|uniref:Uncharacterized protein n=1 Tax=Trichogramma brassicae TaxID=86971 RepID=A0A6H5ISA9_9HYME|nr:unnamed protein product [Trichogramma brassicae]
MSLSVNDFDGNPELFKKLKDLINKINWNIEEERCNFLVQFYLMLKDGIEYPFPAVQHYLRPEEIQRLIWDSINYEDKERGYIPGNVFLQITVIDRYTDEPDIDENGIISPRRTTPIHQAVKNVEKPRDWIRVFRDLFKIYNRFDVNYTDETGYTHFHAACQFSCEEAVQRFLEHGQDPNCIWPETGDSALHIALRFIWTNDIMVLLLRGGADSNLANEKGLTPLHTIAQLCWDAKIEIEQFFLINDELNQLVHIDARDKFGNTPLHVALNEGWAEVVEVLLRRGANPNLANDGGHTPLHVICARGQFHADDLAETFFKINDELNQRVQIDARDKLGRTPLQLAVANLGLYTVRSLLNRGADLSSFVFPSSSQLDERFESIRYKGIRYKLGLASSLLADIECLEKRGYELDRSDALTIMKLFSKYELFEKSANDEKLFCNDEEFATSAKKIMVKPDLSLFDLIHLQPQEAARRLTYTDYYELAKWNKLPCSCSGKQLEACYRRVCETMSRKFFLDWAMDPFIELIHYRLPILCCYMILENLNNEDLYNICLAAISPTDKDAIVSELKIQRDGAGRVPPLAHGKQFFFI